jgi:hypothetical protein
MNEEQTPPGAEFPRIDPTGADASNPTESSAAKPRFRLPKWLPLLGLAIVPAVLVGLAVYFLAGDDDSAAGGGGASQAVLDGFVRLSLGQSESVDSYAKDLPPGFPGDLPSYGDADFDGSFAIKSAEGTTYIITYDTSASVESVYDFFRQELDKDPWQVELSRQAEDFTGVQFSRPDSADISGTVSISKSELDGRTAIFVFLADSSQTSSGSGAAGVGVPTISKPLPQNFPNDVPIYKGDSNSIVRETYFQREGGQNTFLITFLTRDSDLDVIDFYTKEFQGRGWTVKDGETQPGDTALSIDFDDAKTTPEVQGSIRAEAFAGDASYTEVNLIVQVSASRGRGN